MPYDNPLNKKISDEMNKIYYKYINHTPMSYDFAESNVGTSNKKLIDDSNIERETAELKNKELIGGALGAVGGFAKGTIRDTGEGKTLGAGKKKKEENTLLLKRELEGGNIGLLNKVQDKMNEVIKKRGRPNKMKGGTDLAEPHNMVNKEGITGYGKLDRQIGGKKLVPVDQMKGSSMSGFGKNESRIDIVKRLMKDRNVNMIEASKICKKENLYIKKQDKKQSKK
jgi:hypothetical protein